jgi:hypothetical protein
MLFLVTKSRTIVPSLKIQKKITVCYKSLINMELNIIDRLNLIKRL